MAMLRWKWDRAWIIIRRLWCTLFALGVCFCGAEGALTEINGAVYFDAGILTLKNSPYLVTNDIVIEKSGRLTIEPGSELRFLPGVGMTIRGVLLAEGNSMRKITMTKHEDEVLPELFEPPKAIRLVDGSTILEGRLQLFYNDHWRSVCTNSRNWTELDFKVTCQQLGYQGGQFFRWFQKNNDSRQLLYERPSCQGNENSLLSCNASAIKLGSGVCDEHFDMGIQCLGKPLTRKINHWRGLQFESMENRLFTNNFLRTRQKKSLSRLSDLDILYAGYNRTGTLTSALSIIHIPPLINKVTIKWSAYNAINVTKSDVEFEMANSLIDSNRGYGIFINSSSGSSYIDNCKIINNGADGIRYVHHDILTAPGNTNDLCSGADQGRDQYYPIRLFMKQQRLSRNDRDCQKTFLVQRMQEKLVLTIHFSYWWSEINDGGSVEIRDGENVNSPLLLRFTISNTTRPQSISTTGSALWIRAIMKQNNNALLIVDVESGLGKVADLNVSSSVIRKNNGRGIAMENIRSMLAVSYSQIENNNYVAGIHVFNGSGDVNITSSTVSSNVGDGVNISYAGGRRNFTKCIISKNQGHGVSVWFNESSTYLVDVQHMDIFSSNISDNLETGLKVGNFCGDSVINITESYIARNLKFGLEILSCWKPNTGLTYLYLMLNTFTQNRLTGFIMKPAVNLISDISNNLFQNHHHSALFIQNEDNEELEELTSSLKIYENRFENNKGYFVASIGVSQYGFSQELKFTHNWLVNNVVAEPFESLNPRGRVSAVVVISSSNAQVYRNIFNNRESKYDLGSWLENPYTQINGSLNWLGGADDFYCYNRVFDSKFRYNLATIKHYPYIRDQTDPDSWAISIDQELIRDILNEGQLGGVLRGRKTLYQGEYEVVSDLIIQSKAELTLRPGAILNFHRSVGIMNNGRLIIDSKFGSEKVSFKLQDQNESAFSGNVRLLHHDANELEGRLEVFIDGAWGTICNYGWTMIDAALACHQMGYVLNPEDWHLEPSELPLGQIKDPIHLSNVKCHELDTDLALCASESTKDFAGSCTHDNDVGIRCYEQGWAGIHFGVMSAGNVLKNILVTQAGLLDPMQNALQAAIQFDLCNADLSGVVVEKNIQDGIAVYYNNLYFDNKFYDVSASYNKGSGVKTYSQGLFIDRSKLYNNFVSGFQYNPNINFAAERKLISRIDTSRKELVEILTGDFDRPLGRGQKVFLMTNRDPEKQCTGKITTESNNVLSILVIGSVHPKSTEQLKISETGLNFFDVAQDMILFPLVTNGSRLTVQYTSGKKPYGMTVLYVVAIERIEHPRYPTIRIAETEFSRNAQGISIFHYNLFRNENQDRYLRVKNESIEILRCSIKDSSRESIHVNTPHREQTMSALGNITYVINNTIISNNNGGIVQVSRDIRNSNNHFHWIIGRSTFQNNYKGGVDLPLPFVWQQDNNDSHSYYIQANFFVNNSDFKFLIDGYYSKVYVLENSFLNNECKKGLINIWGMEKEMYIHRNLINLNLCQFLVEFDINSHTDLDGTVTAEFKNNIVQNNRFNPKAQQTNEYQPYNYAISVKGIQKINTTNNIFEGNQFQYEFLAGIRTSSLDNTINVRENWWGMVRSDKIRERIFDFDDWNSFAIADFSPFLLEPSINTPNIGWDRRNDSYVDLNNLGGRITFDIVLRYRRDPYIIKSDLTVMPGATLIIDPGVTLEFYPSVGILVLGALKAFGRPEARITMAPVKTLNLPTYYSMKNQIRKREGNTVRLCASYNTQKICNYNREGFIEIYNTTTKQWIPLCHKQFTRHNAEVICNELGFDTLNVHVKFGPRLDVDPTYLSRIYAWPEPRECGGQEDHFLDCNLQFGDDFKKVYSCSQTEDFVFVHCGKRNLIDRHYWGGIRFSAPNFEEKVIYPYDKAHSTVQIQDSILECVDIIGAGILHNEKNAAIHSTFKTPKYLKYLNITTSASHGVNAIAPSTGIYMHENRIENNLGVGLVILVLNGDSGDRNDSTFNPLTIAHLPYNAFGMVEMCESHKILEIEERILLYFKYYNNPVDCVKIFTSTHKVKKVGLRLLQFKFFKSSGDSRFSDQLRIFDGDIYNRSSKLLGTVSENSNNKKLFFRAGTTLSVQLRASGAAEDYGFIAEIITLPAFVVGSGRATQFNVSYSLFSENQMGGAVYGAAGEENPSISFIFNQFKDNGLKMFGNFTSSAAAVLADVRNTVNFNFNNNLVLRNQGGLHIMTESSSTVVGLNGYITNNLFAENYNHKTMYIKGGDVTIQTATINRNVFTRNLVMYDENMHFEMIKLNFFNNYVYNNTGQFALAVHGYEMLRMQLYQRVKFNAFHNNTASALEYKSTIFAGGAGQSYEENVLMNLMNDFEIIARNKSVNLKENRIDATNNWWGSNFSTAISGRIRDYNDFSELLEVVYEPFYMNNQTLVDGKCPPGWSGVGTTCFLYVGGVMSLEEAKAYCTSIGASLPYLKDSNEDLIRSFVEKQQVNYDSDFKVWILSIDYSPKDCIALSAREVHRMRCEEPLSFLCEKDPDIVLELLTDTMTIAALSAAAAALLLVLMCVAFWVCKSRQRRKERLERRNSIRASKRSVRSLSMGSFPSDINASRRMIDDSKTVKMVEMPFKGSFDSIEKTPSRFDSSSYFNSSIEDNQSYEICEAANHKIEYSDFDDKYETESRPTDRTAQSTMIHPAIGYGFDNKGFLENTFSKDESQPWGSSSCTDSTVDMKRYLETSLDTNGRDETYTSRSTPSNYSQEQLHRRQMLETDM